MLVGFCQLEQIGKTIHSIIYRGIRERDRLPVIIKLICQEFPHPQTISSFQKEYEILKSLEDSGIIKAYDLIRHDHRLALILEDFGGQSLDRMKQKPGFAVPEILSISLKTVKALAAIHDANIIHKDINPSNILYSSETQELKISDFGIATQLPKEQKNLTNHNKLVGTLAYISPEQTGRMNRGLDYRSDYYSLGISVYELLTQRLPFLSQEPMELIHAHLAKIPPSPHEINPKVPKPVSDIVMKLMAKNAEDRYQSAEGILHDLEGCLDLLSKPHKIHGFELGQQDICDRFIIPDKLYGRATEVQTLLDSFERVAQGNSELMLVTGFSGIGKTAVINEVYKPITRRKGYFIKGKFDQFNRDIPFSALVQAFDSLVKQLLTESDRHINQWKNKILAALGNNAQVIIDVIPNLEIILGKQPTPPELSGSVAQNRFNLVFGQFVRVFTQQEHPLVIFLDDLQWADSASLSLLKLLMNQSEQTTGSLMVLGAYRNNEVSPAHPLMLCLKELEKQPACIQTLTLEPLVESDINYLVADTLLCSTLVAASLSGLVYQKTSGNPFFTTQFLKGLYEDGYINFNRQENCWQCNINQIRNLVLTDDVVEFIVVRLQKLPVATRDVLKLAACIGNQFDLATLAVICEQNQLDVANNIWFALQTGLIIPETYIYRLYTKYQVLNKPDCNLIRYRFLHDRVQQSAYALISEDERQEVHLKIGRLLKDRISLEQQADKIFEIINQINIGSSLLVDVQDREEAVKLNLAAGNRAKHSTAYKTAAQYFRKGLQLLEKNCWQQQYSITFEIYHKLAEVEYLTGNFEQCNSLIESALTHVKSRIDRVKLYNILIVSNTISTNHQQAIKTGLKSLKLLHEPLPEVDLDNQLKIEFKNAKDKLSSTDIGFLINAKNIENEEKKLAIEVLKNIDPPTYFANLPLYYLVVVRSVNLSLQYGNSPESSKGFCTYGLLQSVMFNQFQEGLEFGNLALALSEKFNNPSQISQVCVVLGGYLKHWVHPLKTTKSILDKGYQVGAECGDLQFAGYSLIFKVLHLFYSGINLETLLVEIAPLLKFARESQNHWAIDAITACEIIALNLSNKTSNLADFSTAHLEEEQYIAMGKSHGSFSWISTYLTIKSKVMYMYGDFQAGLALAQEAESYLSFVAGMFSSAEHNFSTSLNLVALLREKIANQAAKLAQSEPNPTSLDIEQELERVYQNQKQLKKWADSCPENFLHKYDLVQAEISQLMGDKTAAIELYDRAIVGAQENSFIQEEALANELAAKFYLDWGKDKVAAGYLQEAHYCYAQWGAQAKINQLEQQYPELLSPILQQSTRIFDSIATLSSLPNLDRSDKLTQSPFSSLNNVLDFSAILKSAQALTETLELDKLLQKLSQVILQNSGCDRQIIVLIDDTETSHISVISDPNNVEYIFEPLETYPDSPKELINYVKNTQKVVLIDDLETDLLCSDRYILQHQPKSILALPLKYQDKTIGVVYLHSSQISNLFSKDRITILKFLCSQAAIAIYNAQLFADANLKSRVLESSVDGIAILEHGKFMYANAKYLSLYGYDLQELAGQSWTKLYAPDEAKRLQLEIFPILALNGNWRGESTAICKDRSPFPIEISIFLLDDGKLIFISRNISDRKVAEKSLIETKNKFRNLVSNIYGAVYRFQNDAHWTVDFISSAICELSGFPAADFMQNRVKTYASIIHPEDLDYVNQERTQALVRQESFVLEYRIVHYNGSIRWVFEKGKGIYDSSEKLLHLEGVIFDISDRKKAEEALKLSSVRDRAIFEQASVGFVEIDLTTGKLTRVNDLFAQMTGYSRTELQELSIIDVTHPKDRDRLVNTLKQFVSGETRKFSTEKRFQRKDGSSFWSETTAYPIEFEGSSVKTIFKIVKNIDDRKAAEKSLQASENKFRTLVANVEGAVYRCKLDSDWTMEYISPAIEILCGYPPEDFINQQKSFDSVIHPEDRLHAQQVVQQATARNQAFTLEYRIIHRNGKVRWVYERGKAIYKFGRIKCLEGVMFDISDRKFVEAEQKRQLAILESTSDFIGTANPDGQMLYLNRAWKKLLAQNQQEIGPSTKVDSQHPTWALEKIHNQGLPQAIQQGMWTGETAILDTNGQEIPVSQVIIAHKTENNEVGYFSTIMRDISDRKKLEQEITQREEALTAIVEGTAAKTGADFYRTCVRYLSEIFAVKYAFIGELDPQSPDQSRISVLWNGTDFVEPYVMDLPGSPCLKTFQDGFYIARDSLIRLFPDADTLALLEMSSYASTTIVNSKGQAIGNLGIMDCKALPNDSTNVEFILQLFATRVGAEMERQAAEDALRNSQTQLQLNNEDLENRVQERTFALEKSNQELELAKQSLEKSNEYEKTLNQIIRDIRQTLELEKIFKFATTEVRQVLQSERVAIYQFNPDATGKFIYESKQKALKPLANSDLLKWNDSFLTNSEASSYTFTDIYEVSDIYKAAHSPDHLAALEKSHIRAYLVVPIFVGDRLWGLLATYHHSSPRIWQPIEIKLFQQVSSHLGVALTQAELLQKMITAKEEADSANRSKSEFLANMSHELRTPLNGILGYAQTLLESKNTLTTNQIKGLKIIYNSGDHLLNLINEILDHAKIEAGKLELLPKNIHLLSFLQEIVDMMSVHTQAKKINFKYSVTSPLPTYIYADEKRLRQTLLNLLSNAVKFTDKGEVVFSVKATSPVKINDPPGQNYQTICFSIQDSGIGINPAQLKKIFNPFEQVGNKKRQSGGTGLGLNITKQLVEKMGGQLKVKSKLNVGSTFWFKISLLCTDKSAKQVQMESIPNIKTETNYKASRQSLEVINHQEFMLPPLEEISILYELSLLGSMQKIKKRAKYLEKLDSKYTYLANQLIELADNYQDKEITDLIEQCMNVGELQ